MLPDRSIADHDLHAGLRYRYRLSGGPPTIERFVVKDAEVLARGDMVNLDHGKIDLAVTGDVDLIGVVAGIAGEHSAAAILVITDADAVFGVTDGHGRLKGATLDVTGLTGVQGVAGSVNAELVVVLDCAAYEETLVRINGASRHRWLPEDRRGLTGGELNAAIARDVVRRHSEHRGRGPTRARAFYRDDVVVVILQEVMTTTERSLAASGKVDAVMAVRDALQEVMRADLVASVEHLTGCKVQTLMSANSVDPDCAAQVFILDRPVPGDQAALE